MGKNIQFKKIIKFNNITIIMEKVIQSIKNKEILLIIIKTNINKKIIV
jgi:hypothetical protein